MTPARNTWESSSVSALWRACSTRRIRRARNIWLRSLLREIEGRALVQGIEEGLLILGWVAMWRPVEILLFEHWESHQDHAMLQRLASIPIEFVFLPGTSRQEDGLPDDR